MYTLSYCCSFEVNAIPACIPQEVAVISNMAILQCTCSHTNSITMNIRKYSGTSLIRTL